MTLDHIVLNVADAERSLSYYVDILGLEGERVDLWRKGEAPFPSVRVSPDTIIDLFEVDRTGENLNHFCLALAKPRWDELMGSGLIRVERGPVQVFGAHGQGTSIYTSDPDGNTVELRYYE